MNPVFFRPDSRAARCLRGWLAGALVFLGLALAAVAVPVAPTALRGAVTASTSVTLIWDDNSTDETHFEIASTLNGVTQAPLVLTSTTTAGTGTTGFVRNITAGASYTFAIRAYTGTNANASAYTNTVAVKSGDFNVPTSPFALVLANGWILLRWTDNAYSEAGYFVEFATAAGGPWTLAGSAGVNVTGFNFLTGLAPATTYYFRIRGFKGTAASPTAVTTYTNEPPVSVTVSATTPAVLAAPTGLVATPVNETNVNLAYADNTANNTGYEIYLKAPGGSFTYLGDAGDVTTVNTGSILAPGTAYDFQVRAYYQNGASRVYSNYSNIATAATPFYAPTGLVVTPIGEKAVNFTFADNSAANTGYEVEIRLTANGGAFTYLGDLADVTSTNTGNILAPGTSFDFQVRAYYQNGANPRVYSATYSNVTTAVTPFYAPTNFTVTPSATSPYVLSFSWTDNSNVEDSYELEYRKQGAPAFTSRKIAGANVTGMPNLPEFEAGTVYEFRLHGRLGSLNTAYAPSAAGLVVTTRNGFSSKPYAPIQMGTPFSYQMTTSSLAAVTALNVSGLLPPGLTFNSGTGLISGTPTTAGVYAVQMTATFASGPAQTMNLVLRILPPLAPPRITTPISAQTLTQGGSGAIALDTKFADPDTESAVRMATTKGNVDLVFYANTTPQTVANFLTYNYSDVIFHRAPAGFVLQGGGFKTYAAPDVFEHIATPATVPNEPGISNTLGTVAMAKVGDNPDSATSEFFINLGDNSANLDNQNGGFTVFGRVAAPSLGSTVAALAAVPVGNYAVGLHTGPLATDIVGSTFTDLPLDQSPVPAMVDQSKLLKITSVTALPVLTYAVTGNTNPSVASAAVVGTSVQFSGLAPGVASITVAATDVDGNVTPQTFAVTVQQTLAQWAAAQGVPGGQSGAADNPDHDALTNLQEWAFFGNPNVADTAAHLPTLALTPVTGAKFLEITFPVRKYAANLTYSVEASGTLLPGDWTVLWSSTQGFATPAVTAAVDQTDRTIVTIRDSASSPTAARRYLRAKVQ